MTDVDPKTRQLLDIMAAAGPLDYATLTPEMLRARAAMGRAMLEGETPGPLAVVRDVAIAGAAGPLKARIYDRTDASARPTLAYFHGGGFVYGDLDSHDAVCRRLAFEGDLRVVAVDYRLAPEHPFPAPVNDAIAALADLAANAEAFGADPSRLAVGGDSAGGNLSAVAARHAARNGGPKLKFQLLIYPVTQQGQDTASRRQFAEGYFLTKAGMDWFHARYLPEGTDKADERVSPLSVPPPSGLAPALVITAGFDPLRDEGAAYAHALMQGGIAAEHVDYPDQIHGFFNFPAFSNVAADAIRHAARTVAAALG